MALTVGKAVVIDSSKFELGIAQKRIEVLEKLLAQEIQKVADLLKENVQLEVDLEKTRNKRDCWRKLYRNIKPEEKVICDRSKAMVEFAEVDMSEVVGSK